jgi:hypothetical protein
MALNAGLAFRNPGAIQPCRIQFQTIDQKILMD